MIVTHRYEADIQEPLPGRLLEIETTGLHPERGQVTVISTGDIREDRLHITQWIAAAKEDEGALLARALPQLSDRALTVFHAPFLVPFLAGRAERAGLAFAPASVTDLRTELLSLRPFHPFEKGSRNAICEALGLELPAEPGGEDVARLTRRLYKQYDARIAERIAQHNLLHQKALYGMAVFACRWRGYLTRRHPFFQSPVRLLDAKAGSDFLTATFSVRNEPPAFLSLGPCELTVQGQRAMLRVQIKEGMITETMPCLFAEIFDFPGLKDTTGFHVPEGVFLLQVEDRFLPESVFALLDALLARSGCGGGAGFAEVRHENQREDHRAHE